MQLETPPLDVFLAPPIPEGGAVLRTSVYWGAELLEVDAGPLELAPGAEIALRRADGSIVRAGAGVEPGPNERVAARDGAITRVQEWVPRVPAPARRAELDWTFPWVLAVAGMMHAFFVAAAWITPEPEPLHESGIFQRTGTWTKILRKEEPKKPVKLAARDSAKAPLQEGTIGRPDLPRRDAERSKRGAPRVDADKRRRDQELVRKIGLLGAINSLGASASATVLGPGGIGGGINNAFGGISGATLGDAGGAGGLGTRGIGPGGGGDPLGVGGLSTRGGRGPGGKDYGDVRLAGRKKCEGEDCPLVRPGRPAQTGPGLKREEISRVIHRALPRFRHCYEKELNADPNLFGKVALRFVIGPTGHVGESNVHEATIDSSNVQRCVNAVMRSLEFPRVRGGGTVIVTYPFIFEST